MEPNNKEDRVVVAVTKEKNNTMTIVIVVAVLALAAGAALMWVFTPDGTKLLFLSKLELSLHLL